MNIDHRTLFHHREGADVIEHYGPDPFCQPCIELDVAERAGRVLTPTPKPPPAPPSPDNPTTGDGIEDEA